MASWEDELVVLLRELGVTLEEPRIHLGPTYIHEDHQQEILPLREKKDSKRQTRSTDAFIWERAGNSSIDEDDAWLSDLRLMRSEVESIVIQVVRLMQHGDLDPSLKEDVMVVLRALRRRASVTQQAAASDAAYLEFAAAMLHFCRLVLRLSEAATEDL
jgi:hypothetical protein